MLCILGVYGTVNVLIRFSSMTKRALHQIADGVNPYKQIHKYRATALIRPSNLNGVFVVSGMPVIKE